MAMTATQAMNQATATAEVYLEGALHALKKHDMDPLEFPEIVAALIAAASQDYQSAVEMNVIY
jgi:hypothetical protein